MFSGLESPTHILILLILLVLLCVLFGAKRLPELGRSLGTGMREFKETVTRSTPPPLDVTQETDAEKA